MSVDKHPDLASMRARLDGLRGRQFWRSLEELAETPEFRRVVEREFPQAAAEWFDPVARRGFLKLMGASLALAGATACTRQPDELLVPYVKTPENMVPGRPLFFATAMSLGSSAIGLLAESHEGRPTKIEGNPDHPASLGATDAFAQASVLQLYDPDRSPSITYLGEIRPWASFVTAMRNALSERQALQGAGLRILTESIASPTLASQLAEITTALPQVKLHQYEPVNDDQVLAGAAIAFGSPVRTHYRFDRAQVVVSLDADVFGSGAGSVRYARDFANGRRVRKAKAEMNRLYVAESMTTPTGALADHRVPARAGRSTLWRVRCRPRSRDQVSPERAIRTSTSGWRPLPPISPRTVVSRSWWPDPHSLPPCTPSSTRSITRWATRARRSCTLRSRRERRPIKRSRCATSSPT